MTTHRSRAIAIALFAAAAFVLPPAGGGKLGRLPPPDPVDDPVGSIGPIGKPNATQRLAMAKITFQEAGQAALDAVQGRMICGELEIDAGNKAVLATDDADDT